MILKQNARAKDLFAAQNHTINSNNHRTSTTTDTHNSNNPDNHKRITKPDAHTGKLTYLKKFLLQHGGSKTSPRPEGWAAAKVNRAIHRLYLAQLLASNRLPKYLYAQSKKLFEECCKCCPLASGPAVSTEDGILQLAGPNLHKILRILRSSTNIGIDLLQPHGIAQCVRPEVSRGMNTMADAVSTDLLMDGWMTGTL